MKGKKQSKGSKTKNFGIPKEPLKTPSFPTVHSGKAFQGSTDHLPPAFSFYHFDSDSECPSTWNSDEMKSLFTSLKLASSMTWQQVRSTGGQARNAQGIAYKPVSLKQAARKLPGNLAEDIDLSEMRISDRARIFGVRNEATYYIVWLDKDHQVFPEGKQFR